MASRLVATGEGGAGAAAKLDMVATAFGKAKNAAGETTAALETGTPVTDDAAESTENLAQMASDAADQLNEQRDAQLDLMNATNEALYVNLDYADQQAETSEAVANLATVQSDSTSSAEEIAQAQRDAERAILDEAAAAADNAQKVAAMSGETLTAAQMTDIQRAKLEELRQKFPEMGAAIDGYIQWLYRIPTSVTTDVRTSGKVVSGGQGGQILVGKSGIIGFYIIETPGEFGSDSEDWFIGQRSLQTIRC